MNSFEEELKQIAEEQAEQEEKKLPSLEEQREIVAKLKALEAAGELTPEVLEAHFGEFYATNSKSVH